MKKTKKKLDGKISRESRAFKRPSIDIVTMF